MGRTSLREEGAEPLIRGGGLALFGEIAIGLENGGRVSRISKGEGRVEGEDRIYLNSVLEAVQLEAGNVMVSGGQQGTQRGGGLKVKLRGGSRSCYSQEQQAPKVYMQPTSQQELAIWQPAWPTRG